jgi:hypothetical protein
MSATLANRAAFALAVAISLVALFAPGSDVPGGPPFSDKVVHAALFGLVALTGLRAGVPATRLVVALLTYAVVSEVLQASLPIGRDGSVGDVAADAVGVGLGVLVVLSRSSRRG